MTPATRPWILAATLLVGWCASAQAAPVLSDGYKGTLALAPTYFTETDVGTNDPSATYTAVPGYGSLTISYGSYFAGQSYAFDPTNPAVPVRTGSTANAPLQLALDPFLSALVEDDADAPTNPVVGGSILGTYGFIGPVAILFSTPVAAVELVVGNLVDAGQITLDAFAADGSSLGSLTNTGSGYEVFDLSSSGGPISGLALRASFDGLPPNAGVSGVGVFAPAVLPPTPVPAPGTSALALAALLGAAAVRRSRHA